MTTPRKPYVRLETSLLREPWDHATKGTLCLLMCMMGDRWARDKLTAKEAETITLTAGMMMDITGKNSFGPAVSALKRLSEKVSIEMEVIGPCGCVYFVRSGDEVKIGQTSHLESRLLRLGNPSLIGVIPDDEASKLEKKIHRMFKETRLHGEWFEAEPRLLDFIESLPANYPRARQARDGIETRAVHELSANCPRTVRELPRVVIRWPKWPETQELPSRGREISTRRMPISAPAPAPAHSKTYNTLSVVPAKPPRTRSKPDLPVWALANADLLIELLREVPGARIPKNSRDRWAREIRLLVKEVPDLKALDDPGKQIEYAIRWVLGPDNAGQYALVVRSGKALREKWPRIVSAAQRSIENSPSGKQASSDKRWADLKDEILGPDRKGIK